MPLLEYEQEKKPRILPSTGNFNMFIPVRPSFGYAGSSQKAMENIEIYLRVRNFFPPLEQLVEKYFSHLKDAVLFIPAFPITWLSL